MIKMENSSTASQIMVLKKIRLHDLIEEESTLVGGLKDGNPGSIID